MQFETDQLVEMNSNDYTSGRQGQIITSEVQKGKLRYQVRWFYNQDGNRVSWRSKDGSLKTWVSPSLLKPLPDSKWYGYKKGN